MLHPALESHPQHDLWRRDMKGASGVFGFVLKKEPSRDDLSRLLDPMRVFAMGLSWGGFQSLIKAGKVEDRARSAIGTGRSSGSASASRMSSP